MRNNWGGYQQHKSDWDGIWNTSATTSNIEYRYGTDNSTALQNAINAATTGLNLQLPCGGMMFSSPLTIPAASGNNIPVVVQGCGAGDLMFEQSLGNSKNLLAFGSELDYANTASASPAITIYTVAQMSCTPSLLTFATLLSGVELATTRTAEDTGRER